MLEKDKKPLTITTINRNNKIQEAGRKNGNTNTNIVTVYTLFTCDIRKVLAIA